MSPKLDPPNGAVGKRIRDVIRVEAEGGADDRREAPQDAPRSIVTVFADATDAYAAVGQLRAKGFRIDLSASIAGDLIVSVQAGRARADEVGALVAEHGGRVETPSWGLPGPAPRPGASEAATR